MTAPVRRLVPLLLALLVRGEVALGAGCPEGRYLVSGPSLLGGTGTDGDVIEIADDQVTIRSGCPA